MTACFAGSEHVHVSSGKAWMAGTNPAMMPSFQVSKRFQTLRKIWTYSERWIVSTR
jgi:hypothetical protein